MTTPSGEKEKQTLPESESEHPTPKKHQKKVRFAKSVLVKKIEYSVTDQEKPPSRKSPDQSEIDRRRNKIEIPKSVLDAPWEVDEESIIFPRSSKAQNARKELSAIKQSELMRWEQVLREHSFGEETYYQYWQYFREFTHHTQNILDPKCFRQQILCKNIAASIKTWNQAVFDWLVELARVEAQASNPGVNMFAIWLDEALQTQPKWEGVFDWRHLSELQDQDSKVLRHLLSVQPEKPCLCSDTGESDSSHSECKCTTDYPSFQTSAEDESRDGGGYEVKRKKTSDSDDVYDDVYDWLQVGL